MTNVSLSPPQRKSESRHFWVYDVLMAAIVGIILVQCYLIRVFHEQTAIPLPERLLMLEQGEINRDNQLLLLTPPPRTTANTTITSQLLFSKQRQPLQPLDVLTPRVLVPPIDDQDAFYKQNRSFTRSLPCIYQWANNTQRLYRHEWMFPCSVNQMIDGVAQNWTYLHVMKAGGTTAFNQCGFSTVPEESKRWGPLRAEWMYRTSQVFTFVRDPVDHFLSGYKECASSRQPSSFPWPNKLTPAGDDDILLWLHTLGHRNHTNRLKNPLKVFYCFLHSVPQIEFFLFHDDDGVLEARNNIVPSTDILPHVRFVGDMRDIQEFYQRTGLPWNDTKTNKRNHAIKKKDGDIRAAIEKYNY
eukprot:CAMPEP_0178504092 /NCGR_PEP_ID=MMETSP0696-20121128/18402_1 /TAXON_ID=265572 /ORGANISM="Extubocellulus spinifer, Strain CCMP396" /LENGTH=356 /DNA_ID=CAMNT_0020133291 /DNA_START=332 /DNA_END=1401 /DNA_ORIENTATION=-